LTRVYFDIRRRQAKLGLGQRAAGLVAPRSDQATKAEISTAARH